MEIVRGENKILTIPITDVNNAPLLVSSLEFIKVELVNHDRTIARYTLKPEPSNPEIRENPSVNTSVDLEITKPVSSMLQRGELYGKIYLGNNDGAFIVDGQ